MSLGANLFPPFSRFDHAYRRAAIVKEARNNDFSPPADNNEKK
jgi:hypothetical protein